MKLVARLNQPSAENEPLLAREGLFFYLIPALLGLSLLALGYTWAGTTCLVIALAVALFFRNPKRYPPQDARLLLAPADGRLIDLSEVEEGKIAGQPSRRLSIFLSVFNVHVNRFPCQGTIERVDYHPGKFLAAFAEKASLDNEQQATLIAQGSGIKVLVVQIAGLIARRIVCYAKPEEQVSAGKLMGLIRFGSRVDVWLPASAKILVKRGQKIRGGETILALLNEG